MIGIIGAMKPEVEYLSHLIVDMTTETVSGVEYRSGKIGKTDVVIAQCGVGKVFAAVCAQTMILRYHPDVIINTGVAGTLTKKLGICDICIAKQVFQHDMDTSPVGDPVGMLSGINMIYLPCDSGTVETLLAIAGKAKIKAAVGTVASGDQFVATDDVRLRIMGTFEADACEMEGGAIGQVCYINKTPFAVIRAISDSADGESSMDYPTFLGIAAMTSATLVEEYIKHSEK